ncbi:MAG: ABC transporter permease [Defluviitaleaceae bacterium]|nr:ABC transporter permease [Defluviitaleaceae bacterium]
MMNIIRADIYAIIRSKGLYVTFTVLLLFILMSIGTQTAGAIHFGGVWEEGLELAELNFTGINSAQALYTSTDALFFFILALSLIAAIPIFKHGTVKNDLAWGISRTKLYLSKLFVAAVLCVLWFILYIGLGMLLATVLSGFGGPVPEGYWLNLFQTLGAQLVILLALTCVGVFLSFTFKRSGAVNGIFIAFCLVPGLVLMMFMEAGYTLGKILEFDMLVAVSRLGYHNQLDAQAIATMLGVGMFYIIASTVGGIALFKRAEIK